MSWLFDLDGDGKCADWESLLALEVLGAGPDDPPDREGKRKTPAQDRAQLERARLALREALKQEQRALEREWKALEGHGSEAAQARREAVEGRLADTSGAWKRWACDAAALAGAASPVSSAGCTPPGETGSSHWLEQPSPGTSRARWENQLSGAAPCQCLTSGGMMTTSPGRSFRGSLPHSWKSPGRPRTEASVPRPGWHDGYANGCGTLAQRSRCTRPPDRLQAGAGSFGL